MFHRLTRLFSLVMLSLLSAFWAHANDSDQVNCNRSFKIVVLGSSTAFGTGATTYDSSWVGRFTTYVKSKNINNEVYNLGIPGFTTYNNLCPIGFVPPANRPSPVAGFTITDALALSPDAIIINMPSNDAVNDYTIPEQQANFERTMHLADSANIPVWVTTTQPRNFLTSTQNTAIQTMRDWIITRFGVKSIDFYSTVSNGDGSINNFYDFDAVHVNNRGHELFFNRVRAETILDSLCIRYDQNLLIARAGPDQALTLPANSITVDGSQSISNGSSITSYLWQKVSGPANFSITNPNAVSTTITGLTEGRYSFSLTITNSNSLTRSDTMEVVVSSRVLIDFGPDNSGAPDAFGHYWNNISTGTEGFKLSNAVSVANTTTSIGLQILSRIDGTFNTAGPGTNTGNTTGDVGDYPATATTDFAFSHPSATNAQWKITGLDPNKQYRIKFWGSRTGISDARIIEIKRADQNTLWQQYDGTNNVNYDNAAVFLISNKSEMTFDIRTQSGSAFGYIDLIDITYATAPQLGNIPPVADAGNDITVALPNTSTTLNGSNSYDDDGEIVSYQWTKVFGPDGYTIANPTAPSTALTGLQLGEYTFVLTVTDNEGAFTRDTVKVKVASRILFDFGPINTLGADINGNYWNNVSDQVVGVKVANALTTGNTSSGVSLEIINRIDGTFNPSGPGTNSGNSAGDVVDYVTSATADYAFAHPSGTDGLWKLAGLDSTKQYTVKFWGTRTGVSDPRIIEIKRADETNWQSYDAQNNLDYNNAASFTFYGLKEISFNIRCNASSAFGYINVIDINITNPILPCSPAIVIAANPATPICSGSAIAFSSTIINGGTNPAYQWKRNGNNISGATAATFTTTTLLNNDQISCVLTSNQTCEGNNTITSNIVPVTVLPIAPKLGAISGLTNICLFVGTSNTVTYSVAAVANATQYNWTVPAGAVIVSGQGTTSINVLFDNTYPTSDTIKVIAGPCTNSAASTLIVSKTLPDIPAAISGPTNVCTFIGQPITATYSVATVTNATSYIWTVPDGAVITGGQGTTSITVSFLSTFTTGSIKVAASSNCGSRAPRSITVAATKAGVPAVIIGSTDACPFKGTNVPVTYSIAAVANATSYLWTLPANVTLVSGQGTTSIQVTFANAFTTSSIKVRSVTNCGSSSDRALSVSGFVPGTPGAITGPTNACAFVGTGLNATYTIRKIATASSYVWNVPTGATIISHPAGLGVNDTSVVIAYDANFVSGTSISVQSAGCGLSTARSLSISLSGVPSTPGSISGPTNPCSFIANATLATYTIRPVANASSYTWTAPAGASIVDHPSGTGINDTIVTVSFAPGFVSGNITVTSANGCGSNNSARSLALRTLYPSSTPTITGPTNPCPFIGVGEAVYTIRKISNATSYTWTVPAIGATAVHPNGPGINDTIIRVTFTSAFTTGAITARADAECGSSSTRTFTLTRQLSSTPGVLTTTQIAVCPNRQYTYTLAALPSNATGLLWEVPAGATLVSGQGTLSLTVSYPSTAFSGVLKVWGTNNCGLSTSARSMTISLPLCPAAPKFAVNSKGASLDATVLPLDAVAMPNPTVSQFIIRIQSSDARQAIGLKIYDVNGRVLETRSGLQAGQTIPIGAAYRPGFYIAELIQGTQRKQIKLIKQ